MKGSSRPSGGVPSALFHPQSVVIVGASADRTKLSNKPLTNLLALGYAGRVYVVNPGASSVEGVPSYPDIASLPETPDVAFLVVPGELALTAATACATRGVKAAIVASVGFAESGPEGVARQAALTRLTETRGTRFVGPNTNGLYSAHDKLSLGYNASHAEAFTPGDVSVASHSGALFNTIAERLRSVGVGLSKFVAVGNEADLDLLDFFDYMVADPETRTILLLLEAIADGTRFREIAARARAAGKHVAALKLGTSEAGIAATAAHSSRLAGNSRCNAALIRASGIGLVSSVEALVAFAQLSEAQPAAWVPRGRRLGLVTASGAAGTILSDTASRHGFSVATVSEETSRALTAFNADAHVFNPLDTASFGGTRSTGKTAPLLAKDDAVDAVVVFAHKLQTPEQREAFARGLIDAQAVSGKPHVVVAPGGLPEDQIVLFEAANIPLCSDTAATVEALAALFQASAALPASPSMAPPLVMQGITPSITLNEFDSMMLLDDAGIPTIARRLVDSAEEAVAFADQRGWPVVLKALVEGVAHKSDIGLVELSLANPADVEQAYARLMRKTRQLGPEAQTRICIQLMQGGSFEILAGVTQSPPLGRFLLVGQGGRFAEQIDDVHLWAIPVGIDAVREELAATAVGRVLLGPRWKRRESFEELVDALLRLQQAALESEAIQAIEINPLSMTDEGLCALDALVIKDGAVSKPNAWQE